MAEASRNRGRPNKSSWIETQGQPESRASARTRSARRSSISSASKPPGASSAAPPASNVRVASSPSGPLTNASRGSKRRTAGSSSRYSASVRYGGFATIARHRTPASGASRSPSRSSTGTGGHRSAIFSRASAAAWGDRSTAITRSKSPSVASESAMQPHPVPMSATTPPPPPPRPPRSTFQVPRSTRRVQFRTMSTSPSVSGRGMSARRSSCSSSRRKATRPTA